MKKTARILIFKSGKKKEKDALMEYLYDLSAIEIVPSSWFFKSPKDADTLFKEIAALIPSEPHFYLFEVHGIHKGIGDVELNKAMNKK